MGKEERFGDKLGIAGFHVNPQNINRKGRPKKIYTVLKESGFAKEDIITAFNEAAWYTLNQLKKIEKNGRKPAIIRIIARQYLAAYQKKDWAKVREIMQHVIGMPKQIMEHDLTGQRELLEKVFPMIEEIEGPQDDKKALQ